VCCVSGIVIFIQLLR